LQSRYYNPKWKRFINADSLFDTGAGVLGTNMYAYCSNNPVRHVDPTGHEEEDIGFSFIMFFIIGVIGLGSLLPEQIIVPMFEMLSKLDLTPSQWVDSLFNLFTALLPNPSGTSLTLTEAYLDKNVCLETAKNYTESTGLTQELLAQEIYFHAMIYYDRLNRDPLVNVYLAVNWNESWETFRSRADPVNLGGDGVGRRTAFRYVWNNY